MKLISSIRHRYLNLIKKSGRVIMKDLGPSTLSQKALLHYKIDPLFDKSLQNKYYHTNNWEVPEIVRILNSFGYRVDLVDRSNRTWLPDNEYDLLISNASGDSGALYPTYAEHAKSAVKIFYALGPEVNVANKLVLERYNFLEKRTGCKYSPMRVMNIVEIEQCIKVSDAIFCLEDNGFSRATYEHFGLPIHSISPSSSPKCIFNPQWLRQRDLNTFLCFTGDGFIAKGVDLLVEAFSQRPQAQLIIAGPNSDQAFREIYEKIVTKAKNIHYEGFLTVGSNQFNKLMSKCSYIILPASAEGVCTSVTTCMRSGLVPVVTYETGVNASECGFYIKSDIEYIVEDIIEKIDALMNLSKEIYRDKVRATLNKAQAYSQASFTLTFSKALTNIFTKQCFN